MIIYDNEEIEWKERRGRLGRINGAETYGQEILEYQVPLWKKLSDDITISTTNIISNIDNFKPSSVNVQYIHTFPKNEPLKQYRKVSDVVDNVIFVTSYMALNSLAINAGYNSIFIPMTIDKSKIPKRSENRQNRFIWYGNITNDKWETFAKLSRALRGRMDYISGGKLNGRGKKLTQKECWDIIGTYEYGIGVGRCYMEMAAMGMKCIVAGAGIGGLVLTTGDHFTQVDTNYNAREYTNSNDIYWCIENIDKSIPMYENIKDGATLEFIEFNIKEAYAKATNA